MKIKKFFKKQIIASVIIFIILFQLLILGNKFYKTINERRNVSRCAVDCINISNKYLSTDSNLSQKIFKNSELSGIIFLSKKKPNFILYSQKNYSMWNKDKFKKFIDLWGNGEFIIANNLLYNNISKCHVRYDFPIFDLNPATQNGKSVNLTSLYLLKTDEPPSFSIKYDHLTNRLLIIEKNSKNKVTAC